jgi:hypothetical protein
MTEKTTYYALVDDFSSRAQPGGVLRRVGRDAGTVDEVFSRKLTWDPSPLLRAAERGDTMFDFIPISEDEADGIVARIRAEAAQAE